MSPFQNLDVYLEILQYLDFSLEDDTHQLITSNRRTLYSLALTSTRFSNLALDALWRSMETIEPIVHVLNASSPTIPAIYEDNHWKVPCSKDTISRAQTYLSRIRTLRTESIIGGRQRALWQILLANGNFLCPKLRSLWLNVGVYEPNLVYELMPILSPELEVLMVKADGPFSEEIAFTLLDMFHHRDAPLRRISYDGYVSRRIDQYFARFLDLRVLAICPSQLDGESSESISLSEVESLGNLKQLTELRINLDCFLPNVRFGNILSTLRALTTLELIGAWDELSTARILDRTFPNMKYFKLTFYPGEVDVPSASLLSTLPRSVPNIHSLLIDMRRCYQRGITTLSDIQRLQDLPLKSLQLRGMGDALSTEDIIELIKTWPELETLGIGSRGGAFNMVPILANIPDHGTHLESLELPLEFGSWRDFSSWRPFRPSPSLQLLRISGVSNVPETMTDKLDLARTLVSLFPRLRIEIMDLGTQDIKDIAQIVDFSRELLSSPPS